MVDAQRGGRGAVKRGAKGTATRAVGSQRRLRHGGIAHEEGAEVLKAAGAKANAAAFATAAMEDGGNFLIGGLVVDAGVEGTVRSRGAEDGRVQHGRRAVNAVR